MDSYILYKGKTNSSDPIKISKILIKSILEEYIKTKHQPVPKNISNEVSIHGNLHKIKRQQRNCGICSTKAARKMSTFYCVECD